MIREGVGKWLTACVEVVTPLFYIASFALALLLIVSLGFAAYRILLFLVHLL